jgi:DNA helicase-2/ATP-dependent DNA helicase PcrA
LELVNKEKQQFSDILILYRSNYLSRAIEQELISSSIPYYVYGGVKFYQRMEIKDLIAYLKLLVNFDDEISLRRVINIPKRNIGKTTINAIDEYALTNRISFSKALLTIDESIVDRKNIDSFLKLIREIIEFAKNKNIDQIVEHIVEKIGYKQYLNSLDLEERNENIVELINSIKNYQVENHEAKLDDFLNEISLYTNEDKGEDKKKNNVILMTVHAAKGTEMPIVFLVGLNETILPVLPITKADVSIEEERRIAYVAMTRAKYRLYLSS